MSRRVQYGYAKRDKSEPAIKQALQASGWTVDSISITGGPDLIAGRGGETELIECKTGKAKTKAGQDDWHARWRGRPVRILRTVEDVEELNRSLAR